MDKVFVITVCRNAGALLEPTMLSVLEQTYENLQYIIVDGGSTDESTDIIKKYKGRLAAWVSEPDKGIYDAMNKGLRMARSLMDENDEAWVNFMNAGDRFASSSIVGEIFDKGGILFSSSNKKTALVIGGNTRDCFENGIYRIHHAEGANVLSYRLAFSHQSCFVKYKNNINEIWQFDTNYKFAADYNLLHSIYKKFGKDAFVVIDKVVACYRQEGSTSLENGKRTKWEYLKIQSEWLSLTWWKEIVKFFFLR